MSTAHESRILCSSKTRRLLKQQKRGGENYDSLLRNMVEQYDSEKAAESVQHKN